MTRGVDTLKTKTSAKQAKTETERKCLRQKKKERKEERKKKEKGKERGLWQNYNERQINTNARVK